MRRSRIIHDDPRNPFGRQSAADVKQAESPIGDDRIGSHFDLQAPDQSQADGRENEHLKQRRDDAEDPSGPAVLLMQRGFDEGEHDQFRNEKPVNFPGAAMDPPTVTQPCVRRLLDDDPGNELQLIRAQRGRDLFQHSVRVPNDRDRRRVGRQARQARR